MAKAVEPPTTQVVLSSFVVLSGVAPVVYEKGELIEADDPILKRWPDKFGPVVYAHPVKRRVVLATPEVRAD